MHACRTICALGLATMWLVKYRCRELVSNYWCGRCDRVFSNLEVQAQPTEMATLNPAGAVAVTPSSCDSLHSPDMDPKYTCDWLSHLRLSLPAASLSRKRAELFIRSWVREGCAGLLCAFLARPQWCGGQGLHADMHARIMD